MKTKTLSILLLAGLLILAIACSKQGPILNNPANPPQNPNFNSSNGTGERIYYSRDTTQSKAYQLHVKYNSNGVIDILRNEVGAVHASVAIGIIDTPIPVTSVTDTVKANLSAPGSYWLIPFKPGLPAIHVGPGTLLYTCSCTAGPGGPCLIQSTVLLGGAMEMICNPHGCASCSMLAILGNTTYSFPGGTILVQANAVNIKK